MKRILFTLLTIFNLSARAQDPVPCWPNAPYLPADAFGPEDIISRWEATTRKQPEAHQATAISATMTTIRLPETLDLHFISPEPIQYVDISSKNITGDLPINNVLRIRYKDSSKAAEAIVTIAGEKFIAQYHIIPGGQHVPTEINIEPTDTRPLDISGIGLSHPQLKKLAYQIFCNRSNKICQTKAFGLKAQLNHIYSAGDYLFLDISYKNKTNLKYDIDDFRFKIDDKKVTKASNVQSVQIKPELTLFDVPSFSKYYRNIFVLKKMSFPGNKVLNIELSEKQISGRVITLNISYQAVLDADTIPSP